MQVALRPGAPSLSMIPALVSYETPRTAQYGALDCNMLSASCQVFLDLDCTLLEMNPFTLDASGQPFPLDIRMELDDTAKFRCDCYTC